MATAFLLHIRYCMDIISAAENLLGFCSINNIHFQMLRVGCQMAILANLITEQYALYIEYYSK